MGDTEVRNALNELREALEVLDAGESATATGAIHALAGAVDVLRTKVWAFLTTHQAGDLNRYLGEIRVRRATEACDEILADLYAETLAPNTPGLGEFRATLAQVAEISKTVS